MKRSYTLGKRAEAAAETRRRIVDALVELHTTLGPRATTVSDVARRAGVERLTVYNHFPTEADMVAACQSHWLALHPPPDPSEWSLIGDPDRRLLVAIGELYDWYEETEAMTGNVVRDAPAMPAFADVLASMKVANERAGAVITDGRPVAPERLNDVLATLAIATDFNTWRTLRRIAGLGQEAAVLLVLRWIAAAERAAGRPSR